MKYELQTIPVWDALRAGGECLLCTLMKQAEEDSLSYYLGASVMNPETRVQVNQTGFCPHHLQLLAESRKPQSLAVMLRSVLETQDAALRKALDQISTARPGRQTEKAVQALTQTISTRESDCLICRRMNDRLVRYCYTIAVLWKTDPEFRRTLEASRGFCLHHFTSLLEISEEALSPEDRSAFVKAMSALQARGLAQISSDVTWMTQKYKSENAGQPWNGCEDAHKRACYKITGQARIEKH